MIDVIDHSTCFFQKHFKMKSTIIFWYILNVNAYIVILSKYKLYQIVSKPNWYRANCESRCSLRINMHKFAIRKQSITFPSTCRAFDFLIFWNFDVFIARSIGYFLKNGTQYIVTLFLIEIVKTLWIISLDMIFQTILSWFLNELCAVCMEKHSRSCVNIRKSSSCRVVYYVYAIRIFR